MGVACSMLARDSCAVAAVMPEVEAPVAVVDDEPTDDVESLRDDPWDAGAPVLFDRGDSCCRCLMVA